MPISLYDRDMCLLEMSRPWKEMYQINEDKIGKSHYQTLQQQPEHWLKAHQAALNGHTLEHTEEPYKLPNGASGWHRWQCLPWYGDNGEIKGIIISAEDITTKKDREIELNAVLARFELIQQAAKIGMWDWDIVRRNITFNAEYYEVLGWNKFTNISNQQFYDLIHPDDLDRVKGAMDKALSGGSAYEAEFRIYRHNDGKLRWVKDKGTIEFDEQGNPYRGYGAIIDITEQKLVVEQVLRIAGVESQEFLNSLIDGVWSADRNGITIYINRTMAEMLGYSETEMIGRSIYNYLDANWREVANSKISARIQGKSERYVASLKHRDGSDLQVIIGARPILDSGEFVGTLAIVSRYQDYFQIFDKK